jgi:hypothetical protein
MVEGFRRWSCILSLTADCQYVSMLNANRRRSYPLVGSSTRHLEISPEAETVSGTVEQRMAIDRSSPGLEVCV